MIIKILVYNHQTQSKQPATCANTSCEGAALNLWFSSCFHIVASVPTVWRYRHIGSSSYCWISFGFNTKYSGYYLHYSHFGTGLGIFGSGPTLTQTSGILEYTGIFSMVHNINIHNSFCNLCRMACLPCCRMQLVLSLEYQHPL